MITEIEKAVNFLSNLIRNKNPSPDQLALFRKALSTHLANSYTDHWFPERPLRGNAYRCVRIVNNRMDRLVAAAGMDAGLSEAYLLAALPAELSMWVDPAEVSYRIGEDGSVGVVYSARDEEDTNSSNSECGSMSEDSDQEFRISPVPSPHSYVVMPGAMHTTRGQRYFGQMAMNRSYAMMS